MVAITLTDKDVAVILAAMELAAHQVETKRSYQIQQVQSKVLDRALKQTDPAKVTGLTAEWLQDWKGKANAS
jgi:hypothetical protein